MQTEGSSLSRTYRATVASYLLCGIDAGILSPEQAKAWAFSVIESHDAPPSDVIDIAMSSGLLALRTKLKDAEENGDLRLAGRWLLATLNKKLQGDPLQFRTILTQAMQVVNVAELGVDAFVTFDRMDDAVHLAESKTYGSLEACRADLSNALEQYNESANLGVR